MARTDCSSFASSVLRHVVAKLAAATPEAEAACVVSWCKRAAQDELCLFDRMLDEEYEGESLFDRFPCDNYDTPRRQSEYAAAAMLQMAASINGRLALVFCGACETLVHFMLQNRVSSVHGCLYPEMTTPLCGRENWKDRCSCDDLSCYFHRWYVDAALALEGCASGAIRLNRAGWNRNWHVVASRHYTVKDEVILKLDHRALMVPTIVMHLKGEGYLTHDRVYVPPKCICEKDGRSLCPLEEPAFLEFLQTTPGDDHAADEDDELASSVP
jgi:hypothetical protein